MSAARRVYKFPLRLISGSQSVDMPHGAQIIHVQAQGDLPTLWCEVNTSAPMTARTFVVVATGEDVPLSGRYVGTVHLGWTVWHVYEVDA